MRLGTDKISKEKVQVKCSGGTAILGRVDRLTIMCILWMN